MMSEKPDVWEVWQGRTLVCSWKMGLTERQARNKVENERRLGYFMEARPFTPAVAQEPAP